MVIKKKYEDVNYEVIEQAIPEMFEHYKKDLSSYLDNIAQYSQSFLPDYMDNENEFKTARSIASFHFRKASEEHYKSVLDFIKEFYGFEKSKEYALELEQLVGVAYGHMKNYILGCENEIKDRKRKNRKTYK